MSTKKTDTHKVDAVEPTELDEADTEGQNMWVNPGSAGDLARVRQQEQERQMRERKRQKEARGR
jgi:hypothetical protein